MTDGEAWEPVPDEAPGPTDPADRVLREFLAAPEGELREGSLVVRPSLWAALERSVKVLAGLLSLLVPATVAYVLGQPVDQPRPPNALLGFADAWMSIVIPLGAAVLPAVQLAFTRYVLDDEGIRERVQFLNKTERRVPWDKVTALRHRHTLLDRLFRVGRVDVVAYGERGTTLRLVGLHDPAYLRDLVARRMRASASVERLVGND